MSKALPVAVDISTAAILPGAEFSDAYLVKIDEPLSARQAAERMMAGKTWWLDALMFLRKAVTMPFGLKQGPNRQADSDVVGIFPVVRETPERLIAGFDDKHLDFRVVVDVAHADHAPQVTATTVVKTHNLFGRFYLTLITPFHRLIVPHMLRRVALKPR